MLFADILLHLQTDHSWPNRNSNYPSFLRRKRNTEMIQGSFTSAICPPALIARNGRSGTYKHHSPFPLSQRGQRSTNQPHCRKKVRPECSLPLSDACVGNFRNGVEHAVVDYEGVYAAPSVQCCFNHLLGGRGAGEVDGEVAEGVWVGELKVLEGWWSGAGDV
ncbi:unnamed protein product [Tuber aestivum]|uniref:Uncharacterized protein n=1 Tax=Tuber aestivum TaxID=59557 RepID=A0A292PM75_9PEZI|nr:unnamed protein product [Tuber aestivum]